MNTNIGSTRTRQVNGRHHDPRSDQARIYRAWYKTKEWRKIRAQQLALEPNCRMCAQQGRTTPATTCDHIERHKGDKGKFFNGPKQSLCKPCHDGPKQRDERRGYESGCDVKGHPSWW